MNTLHRMLARYKASLVIIRANKKLLVPVFVSQVLYLTLIVLIGIFAWRATGFSTHLKQDLGMAAVLIVFLLLLNLVNIFSTAVLYVASTMALEGEKISISQSIAKVWSNRAMLLRWWAFSSGIGLVIALLQMGLGKLFSSLLGKGVEKIITVITGNILGIGWAFATYFAVQSLMTHPDRPVATLKRSAELIRRSWGENLAMNGGIFLIGLLVIWFGGGFAITGINYLIFRLDPTVPSLVYGLVFAMIDGFLLVSMMMLSSASSAVFNASLYRYADTGDYVGPFSQDMIQNALKKG